MSIDAWNLADAAMGLRADLQALPWWRWLKRRQLHRKADELERDGAEMGLDFAPLFGRPTRLRLGEVDPASK